MRILFKDMKHARVETVSGTFLGHMHDAVIDIGTHGVMQYHVKSPLVSRHQEYLVHPQQIVSVTPERIVVTDSVESTKDVTAKSKPAVASDPLSARHEQSSV